MKEIMMLTSWEKMEKQSREKIVLFEYGFAVAA